MKVRILRYRRVLIVALELGLAVAANYVAFLLRFDGTFPDEYRQPFRDTLPWLIGLRAVAFWWFHLYEGLWRYASLVDLRQIVLAVGVSSTVLGVLVRGVLHFEPYPRTVFVIDSILLIGLLGGVRLVRRFVHEFDRTRSEKRVLIYGAGDAGELIVRDIRKDASYNCEPIGFIDDDPIKRGTSIRGVRVLGAREDLPRVIEDEQPHEIIIAMPTADPRHVRAIVKALEPYRVPIKTVPSMRDIVNGRVEVRSVRALSLEDLIERKAVGMDSEPVRQLVNGRSVLVTGAGGSIGAELSRQVASYGPSRLALLDRYENSLFQLGIDLDRKMPGTRYEQVIADITDRRRMGAVFADFKPDLVFHAAAHKHVPLMEGNPCEAVKNNIRGTRLLAEAALEYGARHFVMISTDKAVNPSSVMGASKRVGELMVQAWNEQSTTRFVVVRFGNVLGSNGSVMQIFERQIAEGGPVTVTHPEIKRYFMLIPEAVQLVMHAAAMTGGAATYVLDMGDPIRLQDLVRNMIRLSGYVPDEEIQIQFVGLRPGEKLYEELVGDGEVTEPSGLPKVLRVRTPIPDSARLWAAVRQLEQLADDGDETGTLAALSSLVPTFRPDPTRARERSGHRPATVTRFKAEGV